VRRLLVKSLSGVKGLGFEGAFVEGHAKLSGGERYAKGTAQREESNVGSPHGRKACVCIAL
jgi:hypothetical protein